MIKKKFIHQILHPCLTPVLISSQSHISLFGILPHTRHHAGQFPPRWSPESRSSCNVNSWHKKLNLLGSRNICSSIRLIGTYLILAKVLFLFNTLAAVHVNISLQNRICKSPTAPLLHMPEFQFDLLHLLPSLPSLVHKKNWAYPEGTLWWAPQGGLQRKSLVSLSQSILTTIATRFLIQKFVASSYVTATNKESARICESQTNKQTNKQTKRQEMRLILTLFRPGKGGFWDPRQLWRCITSWVLKLTTKLGEFS